MVSPAKPNASGHPVAKTPKAPKPPKQDAVIPPELARQNIPSPETKKKLTENTISPKDEPTPQDVNVTKKAQEVLGIEEAPVEEGEDGFDFLDSFMAEETAPSETTDNGPIDAEAEKDGFDFLDDLLGGDEPSKVTENSPQKVSPDQTIDAIKGLVKAASKDLKEVIPSEILSLEQIAQKIMFKISNDDLDNIFQNKTLNESNVSEAEYLDEKIQMDPSKFVNMYDARRNILFTRLENNNDSLKNIQKHIQSLGLSPDKLKNLKIIRLNEEQWERAMTFLGFKSKQSLTDTQSSMKPTEEEQVSEDDIEEQAVRTSTKHSDSTAKKDKVKSGSLSHLEKEIENAIIQEEILIKERTVLREKRDSEKKQRIEEKEIQDWERKHNEIKRDAIVRERKHRTP